MKYLIAFIFVMLVDFTVWALCKASGKETKLENPNYIKIRSKKH